MKGLSMKWRGMNWLTVFFLSLGCWAQQPQTHDVSNPEPIYGANAKWVQGVGPGYWPTVVSGLTVHLATGTCFDVSDTKHTYGGGTISVTNATNYIDLKDSDCSIEIGTSAYQSHKHIAIIVASAGTVTSITDDRSWFVFALTGAGTLSPLFTTIISGSTLNFALSNAAANTVFGNFTGSSGAPSYNAVTACGDSTHALSWIAGSGFGCQVFIIPSVYTLQVNASSLTAGDTVNFNDSTPVAGTNGKNIKFQKSTSGGTDSVSGEIVGDGTATHYLDGTGNYSTPAAGVSGSGTANDCVYWSGTSVVGDFTDFLCNSSTHTMSSGAAGIFDLSASTGTAAFKVPSHATETASAAAVIDYDSTNSNYHANSGADSLVLIVPTASIPVTGDLLDASVASSKLLAHDSGVLTANVVTAASAATATGQQCVSSGSSKTCTFKDGRDVHIIPLCASVGGTAAGGVTYASGWTATNRAGTNNIGCALQAIPSTGGTLYTNSLLLLPSDWDTANQPYLTIIYGSGSNTSGTVIWTASSACTKQDGSVTDDPSFNAESAFATQTMAAASRTWGRNGQFTAVTSGNNCVAGSPILFKIVLSGTASSNINLYQLALVFPTLPVAAAN